MTARQLRTALANAIAALPAGDDHLAKREAARQWRQQVVRRLFDTRPSLLYREDELLSNVLPGRALDPLAIMPEIVPCRKEEDFLVFSYFSLWSSFPTTDRPGRRLKFLIRDLGHPSQPLIGICCLSSPVRQLRVRDEWIGWQGAESRATRARNLVRISDLSTCISLPPYAFLTGGKLIAGLMTSNEARSLYRARYCRQLTLRQSLCADEVYLITTSGCYGSNSPQYKGLKCDGQPLYRFLGYSRGYSHFQIDPVLYEHVKEFVSRRRPETRGKFRTWANSKIRVLRIAARELGISEERLVFTGHQRAIFAAPLVGNWRELLLGKDVCADAISYPASTIVDYWKETWLDKRLQNPDVSGAVKAFQPQSVRISGSLENRCG